MPIPKYNPGSVQTNSVPNVQQSTQAPGLEAFGGGKSAENIANAATGIEAIVQHEKDKADQIAVLDADTRASQLKTKLFYDPDEGAMNRKGKDAVGAVSDYQDQYKQKLSEISESLSNPVQRQAFMAKAQQHSLDFSDQLQKHAAVEIQAYDNETTNASIAIDQDNAVKNFSDPDVVARSLYGQRQTIEQKAQRQGWSPEQTQLAMQQTISQTHSAVLDRMIASGQDIMAEEYMKTNKDELTGRDATIVTKQLEQGSLLGFAQREGDKIMQTAGSESQALAAARDVEDPKKRQALQEEISRRFTQKKQETMEARNSMFDSASVALEQTKGDINAIKSTRQWTLMDQSQREGLEKRAQQLTAGIKPVTNWDKYYDLKTMASTDGTRNDFLQMNLGVARHELGDAEFKEMVNIQTQMRIGKSANELMAGFRTSKDIVEGTAKVMGIAKNPKELELFQRAADEQIQGLNAQLGRKANPQEIQQIVDNLAVKGTTERGFIFDTKKRVYQLENGQGAMFLYEDIPRGERTRAEAYLKNNGISAPTEQQIALAYNAKMNKGRTSAVK